MGTIDTLLQRNHEFATQRFVAGLPMRPSLHALIISCADPRVDPVHIFGLEPVEAVVLRNVGGRVTPGTLQLLQLLLQVPTGSGTPSSAPSGAQASNNASAPFHLIVLHHTDCGITRLASNAALMADYFDVPPAELPAKAIADPRAAVASDIALLRATPSVPSTILVSGLVYDTETGLVEVVVPLAPIHPEQHEE